MNYTLFVLIGLIGFVLMLLSFFVYEAIFRDRGEPMMSTPFFSSFILGGILVIIGLIGVFVYTNKWQNAVEQQYTFYCDGNEVNPNDIDNHNYIVTYNHDSKKVFLSPKGR